MLQYHHKTLVVSKIFEFIFVSGVACKKKCVAYSYIAKDMAKYIHKMEGGGYKISHYTFNAISATSSLAANLAKQTDPIKYSGSEVYDTLIFL